MADDFEPLKSLHIALIDSRNGYDEALKDAEGKGLTPLFKEMIDLRNRDAGELERILADRGEAVNAEGSFMSTVHRVVVSLRSLFTGLDEDVLPGLIDGETRILNYYDEAIAALTPASINQATIVAQRDALRHKVAQMAATKARADKSADT